MDIITAIIVLAILAFLAGGLGTLMLFRRVEKIDDRLSAVEFKMMTNGRRLGQNAIAGIEDALAVAIDLLIKQRADTARMETLLSILQKMRENPNDYDKNRAAGRRPEGFED